jgi:hypothetical protein
MSVLFPPYLLERGVITICKKGDAPECISQMNFGWLTSFYQVVRLPQSRSQSKKRAYFVRGIEFVVRNCRQRACCFFERVANEPNRIFIGRTCDRKYKFFYGRCFTLSVLDNNFNSFTPSLSHSHDARFSFFTGRTDLSIRDSKCASDGSNRSNGLHPRSPLSFIQFEIRADHPSGNQHGNGSESNAYYFIPRLHAFFFQKVATA